MDRRAKINQRILIGLALAALTVGMFALWGVSQPKTTEQPQAPGGPTSPAMTEAQAKYEVRRLLADLDSFKSLQGFHAGAFSDKGLPQAARWHQDATALQARISNDASLPPLLRAAPGNLLGLGLAYRDSRGQETAGTKADREMVLEAVR